MIDHARKIKKAWLEISKSTDVDISIAGIDPIPQFNFKKNHLEFDDIDLFVIHQASKFVLDHLMKKIKIPSEKFFNNLESFGNSVSSTIPIALKEAIDKGKCEGNVILAGFGVGLSWGGVIVKFK